jgi:hypothetical protein
MDPVTIGTAVVTILTPYVADAGKELVKTVGEAGVEKTRELLQWLKGRFAGDPVATTDLSRFEKDPAGYAKPLQDTIENTIKEDPAFAAEISTRITELGPTVAIVQRFKDAQDVTGVEGHIGSGRLSVTQEGDIARNVVGVKGGIGRPG